MSISILDRSVHPDPLKDLHKNKNKLSGPLILTNWTTLIDMMLQKILVITLKKLFCIKYFYYFNITIWCLFTIIYGYFPHCISLGLIGCFNLPICCLLVTCSALQLFPLYNSATGNNILAQLVNTCDQLIASRKPCRRSINRVPTCNITCLFPPKILPESLLVFCFLQKTFCFLLKFALSALPHVSNPIGHTETGADMWPPSFPPFTMWIYRQQVITIFHRVKCL